MDAHMTKLVTRYTNKTELSHIGIFDGLPTLVAISQWLMDIGKAKEFTLNDLFDYPQNKEIKSSNGEYLLVIVKVKIKNAGTGKEKVIRSDEGVYNG